MRGIGPLLRDTMGGAKRRMVTTGDGWFLLVTVLLLALPVVLVGVLYRSGLSALPLEVLIFGLGLAGATFLGHTSRERKRGR